MDKERIVIGEDELADVPTDGTAPSAHQLPPQAAAPQGAPPQPPAPQPAQPKPAAPSLPPVGSAPPRPVGVGGPAQASTATSQIPWLNDPRWSVLIAAAIGIFLGWAFSEITGFSDKIIEVPPRRGMAGVDAIAKSQSHSGTYLGAALKVVNEQVPHDRLIVITDEQSHDRVPDPVAKRAYMINVASARNGVGYGRWLHLDGFSERVLGFINEHERAGTR